MRLHSRHDAFLNYKIYKNEWCNVDQCCLFYSVASQVPDAVDNSKAEMTVGDSEKEEEKDIFNGEESLGEETFCQDST